MVLNGNTKLVSHDYQNLIIGNLYLIHFASDTTASGNQTFIVSGTADTGIGLTSDGYKGDYGRFCYFSNFCNNK